jgi:hypothetical protein
MKNFLHSGRQPHKRAATTQVIVDGSVNGGKFLQASHTPETKHDPFSSSKRQV